MPLGRSFLAFATALILTGLTAAADRHPVVPFLEDDYDRAVADARARGRPIFVEAWAPW